MWVCQRPQIDSTCLLPTDDHTCEKVHRSAVSTQYRGDGSWLLLRSGQEGRSRSRSFLISNIAVCVWNVIITYLMKVGKTKSATGMSAKSPREILFKQLCFDNIFWRCADFEVKAKTTQEKKSGKEEWPFGCLNLETTTITKDNVRCTRGWYLKKLR